MFKAIVGFALVALAAAKTVYDPKDKDMVTIRRNDNLEIVFSGNPTTGETWILKDFETFNSNQFITATNLNKFGGGDYIKNNQGLLGSSGKFSFKFVPEVAGQTAITFINRNVRENIDTEYVVNLNVLGRESF